MAVGHTHLPALAFEVRHEQGGGGQQAVEPTGQDRVAMHAGHGLVKLTRESNRQRMLALAIGLGFRGGQFLQGLQLFLAQPPGQLPGHFALHHPAGIKNTARIFQTGNGHACAPVVQQLDDLLLGQALQRLAHQGAGHIELLGQLLLAQAFTRGQSALQNGLVNGFVDAVCACDLHACSVLGTVPTFIYHDGPPCNPVIPCTPISLRAFWLVSR